jgi:hypothetical protein
LSALEKSWRRHKEIHMRIAAMILAVSIVMPVATFADGPKGHGHPANYGGIVEDVDGMQYELVLKPDVIRIYLDDHGQKVSTKSAKAEATVLKGRERVKVSLTPVGANALEAKGKFPAGAGTRVVAVVTVGGAASSVRFALK